jgi:hypothetical protein
LTGEQLPIGESDKYRYARLDDRPIARQLRHIHGHLLRRGRLETILSVAY